MSESRIAALMAEQFPKSAAAYEQARSCFPSGVTHDGRYLEPFPLFVSSAAGSRKTTLDGTELIDYWVGHGALLLGHSHPDVVAAVLEQMPKGTHYGANHELEIGWARLIQQLVPSAERVRFTSSGTEATLMALRIARMVTGRSKVVKLIGHFHGWHDFLVPTAYAPYVGPDNAVPGISDNVLSDLHPIPPNDLAALEQAIIEQQPACVIIEGTGGHWGAVPVKGDYLKAARELTTKHGVLLILDEVITGFRVHPGGAQAFYGVTPDMTTLAKVVAGGLPGGALAGRADLLEAVAFRNRYGRKIPHPGTYNANPLSAAAGIAALTHVATGAPCEHSNRMAAELRRQLNQMFQQKRANWIAYGEFSMIHILPDYDGPPSASDDFVPCNGDHLQLDGARPAALKHGFRAALMLNGVDWFGWGGLTSAAHTTADIQQTVTAFSKAIDLLREDGLMP